MFVGGSKDMLSSLLNPTIQNTIQNTEMLHVENAFHAIGARITGASARGANAIGAKIKGARYNRS